VQASVEGVYSRIYRCIQCIPRGKVATYGQIAKLIDASGARQVGYALSSTPMDIDIPWHRVINGKGEISQRSDGQGDSEQHVRLLAEGVIPNKHGRINLSSYRWQPAFEDFPGDDANDEDFWRDQVGVG
jgi:methylated-DNA-protein-cysteine methyltransferase-like protein